MKKFFGGTHLTEQWVSAVGAVPLNFSASTKHAVRASFNLFELHRSSD
jgi:hypothetical protein